MFRIYRFLPYTAFKVSFFLMTLFSSCPFVYSLNTVYGTLAIRKFYGILAKLISKLPLERIIIHPGSLFENERTTGEGRTAGGGRHTCTCSWRLLLLLPSGYEISRGEFQIIFHPPTKHRNSLRHFHLREASFGAHATGRLLLLSAVFSFSLYLSSKNNSIYQHFYSKIKFKII